jgi:hypothetical protein
VTVLILGFDLGSLVLVFDLGFGFDSFLVFGRGTWVLGLVLGSDLWSWFWS